MLRDLRKPQSVEVAAGLVAVGVACIRAAGGGGGGASVLLGDLRQPRFLAALLVVV
jgi:hypothetical protein